MTPLLTEGQMVKINLEFSTVYGGCKFCLVKFFEREKKKPL